MIAECWVILFLIVMISIIVMHRNSFAQGVSILPLGLVPLGYILSGPVARWLNKLVPAVDAGLFRISVVLLAQVAACVLFGLLAGNMGGKVARRVYVFTCAGFSVILSVVLINSMHLF